MFVSRAITFMVLFAGLTVPAGVSAAVTTVSPAATRAIAPAFRHSVIGIINVSVNVIRSCEVSSAWVARTAAHTRIVSSAPRAGCDSSLVRIEQSTMPMQSGIAGDDGRVTTVLF